MSEMADGTARYVRFAMVLLAAVAIAGGGIVLLATDVVLAVLPYEVVVALEVFGQLGLYLVLLALLIQSYRIVRHILRSGESAASPPDRDTASRVPTPGDELYHQLISVSDRSDPTYEAVRDRLRARARNALVAAENQTEVDAAEAVATGDWTADDGAAAVLADDEDRPPTSFEDRVLAALGGTDILARRDLRRAMTAVGALAGAAPDARRPTAVPPLESTAAIGPGSETDAGDGGSNTGSQTNEDDGPATNTSADTGSATNASENGESTPAVTTRRTGRWVGITVVALVGIVIGVLYQQPAVIVSSGVGMGFAAYSRLGSVDADPPEIAVERSVSEAHPEPGESVSVTTVVRNEGERRLVDVRIIDGVPSELAVESGSSRAATTLAPGGSAVVQYTVTARRGRHQFDPVQVLCRNASGSVETDVRITASGPDAEGASAAASPSADSPVTEQPTADITTTDTTLTCLPTLQSLPSGVDHLLAHRGSTLSGPLQTTDSGPGVEFHSVREYRSGDPMQRIDWNRYARHGSLATVSFRDDQSATVVIAIDARDSAYRSPDEATPTHAVDRAVDGAAAAFGTLLDAGHTVGLASVGPDPLWLAPGTGREHRITGRTMLGTAPGLSPQPPTARSADRPNADSDADADGPTDTVRTDEGRTVATTAPASGADIDLSHFNRISPASTQLILISPLCDDGALEFVRSLHSSGFALSVVAPDPTTVDGPSRALARVERRERVRQLRSEGGTVIDWGWDSDLQTALRGGR
ncbi:DUF7269 family protein [Natrialba sp. SSL1]|uniref:DUF7269 family protein n=1 Tax=Natrialba sp. SSL1 TaxID=1869245 RepID=UPI0008F8118F|nr:DUF58 domain-containing protein [Natrialba sp. SSL1]OIB58799.1 hypothetical protein BBD46_01685 [Natrialba sp. SSL1]